MKKMLVIVNIVLAICLIVSIIYICKDKFFSGNQNDSDEYIVQSYDDFNVGRGGPGFRSFNEKLSFDDTYIRDNIQMDEELAIEIFKTVIVNRHPIEFGKPYFIAYDHLNDTYLINAYINRGIYRFEISCKDGAIIDSSIFSWPD